VRRTDDSDGIEKGEVEDLLEDYTARRITRRQFFARSAALGVSVSFAAALLAACGGDDEAAAPPAEEPPAGEPPAEAPSSTGAPAEEPAGAPVTGGQLVEGYDRDFTKLDTVQSNWADPGYVAIYEFTVVRDADGAYQPALVDSWEVSDDLLTWTFTIREGLTFQSGAVLDAQGRSREAAEEYGKALAIDARPSQNAAHPAIETQVNERCKRPDIVVLDKRAQQARKQPQQGIERQSQILAVKHRRYRQHNAAERGPPRANQQAQQDHSLKGNIGGQKVRNRRPHPHTERKRHQKECQQRNSLPWPPVLRKKQPTEAARPGQHAGY